MERTDLVSSELRHLFAPYNYYKELCGADTLFRPFYCLGNPADLATPNRSYDDVLKQNGLGYKIIRFSTFVTVAQVRHELCEAYGKLNLVPFEFLKATMQGPGRILVPLQNIHEELPAINVFGNRQSITYIRPIQSLL